VRQGPSHGTACTSNVSHVQGTGAGMILSTPGMGNMELRRGDVLVDWLSSRKVPNLRLYLTGGKPPWLAIIMPHSRAEKRRCQMDLLLFGYRRAWGNDELATRSERKWWVITSLEREEVPQLGRDNPRLPSDVRQSRWTAS